MQIQFNYVDYEDASVESKKVYEVCEKHDKAVLVMEPVKGGTLVNLPQAAQKIFDDLQEGQEKKLFASWNQDFYYGNVLTINGHGRAGACIKCGKCEHVCPQKLPIRELLTQVAGEFE